MLQLSDPARVVLDPRVKRRLDACVAAHLRARTTNCPVAGIGNKWLCAATPRASSLRRCRAAVALLRAPPSMAARPSLPMRGCQPSIAPVGADEFEVGIL